jgi:hypothetical protein
MHEPVLTPNTAPFAFIVGAPRCGTTFLSWHLQQHRDICFSKPKEPHYFAARDLRSLDGDELRRTVQNEYIDRYFAHRCEGATLAEGSVTYLYVPEQLEPILRLWPRAKFIIALRDPLTMLPSLHQRLRFIGDETISDFDRAWAAVPDRRAGRRVPRRCADPRWLDYREAGKLGSYLQRLFDTVGRERCFVSLFDDLVADPAHQLREILDFLELTSVPQSSLKPRRGSSGFKIGWLQRALKRPPRAALNLLGSEQYQARFAKTKKPKSPIKSAIMTARKSLLDWNKAPPPPIKVGDAVAAEIRTAFEGEVALLESLIDRKLDHWLGRGPDAARSQVPEDCFRDNTDIQRSRVA